MRRGLTMVELLVSLGLLSAVTLAVASWTQVVARTTASAAEPVRWKRAADAVLQLVEDDLVTGDFARAGRDRESTRVEVGASELRLRTRAWGPDAAGPVVRRYVLDSFSGELRLERRGPDGRSATRPLLDHVRAWECEIADDEHEEDILTVRLTGVDGTILERRYRLP